ncbi:Transcription factor GAMYB [Acorus gramineus]|uniref:Transcription factor GAMYB n=1 Tax=Acorus gramineus TaxID=55184 RepID=A0AAV9AAT6_ACOGR|nr:Transcription factor GAMYB [Acorus gramineus]
MMRVVGGNIGEGTVDCMKRRWLWTEREDEILRDYVVKHGEGNWEEVAKKTGLNKRSGKSCRFRWKEHLKPGLNKSKLSEKEKQLIVRLHSQFGNHWSIIASQIPGRTDNEVKNYWHTRVKRLQREQLLPNSQSQHVKPSPSPPPPPTTYPPLQQHSNGMEWQAIPPPLMVSPPTYPPSHDHPEPNNIGVSFYVEEHHHQYYNQNIYFPPSHDQYHYSSPPTTEPPLIQNFHGEIQKVIVGGGVTDCMQRDDQHWSYRPTTLASQSIHGDVGCSEGGLQVLNHSSSSKSS